MLKFKSTGQSPEQHWQWAIVRSGLAALLVRTREVINLQNQVAVVDTEADP